MHSTSKTWKKRSFITIHLRMSILQALLFILFMASGSLGAQEALEPNCTGVVDFDECEGKKEDFCPINVTCQCKNEKPFCRCDYYRVDWREFWYMGPKCNHLWNTLDFILVAILPGLGLVIIVVVIFSCLYYQKSRKARNQPKSPYREAHHNPAFAAETAGSLGNAYQQSPRDAWVGQIPKAVLRRPDYDDVPTPSQLESYSPRHAQPVRKPDPAPGFSYQRPQYEKPGYPSSNLPYADYAEERPYRRY